METGNRREGYKYTSDKTDARLEMKEDALLDNVCGPISRTLDTLGGRPCAWICVRRTLNHEHLRIFILDCVAKKR